VSVISEVEKTKKNNEAKRRQYEKNYAVRLFHMREMTSKERQMIPKLGSFFKKKERVEKKEGDLVIYERKKRREWPAKSAKRVGSEARGR